VAPGERLLAWAPVAGGQWVAGTRDALYLPDGRLPWEAIEAADWDHDLARLVGDDVGKPVTHDARAQLDKGRTAALGAQLGDIAGLAPPAVLKLAVV